MREMAKKDTGAKRTGSDGQFGKILSRISPHRKTSSVLFVFLVLLYAASAIVTNYVAGPGIDRIIMLGGRPIPLVMLTGVFSSFSNMSVILLVFLYGWKGFYLCFAVYMIRMLRVLLGAFVTHNIPSIPGIFTSMTTLIAILIIYQRNRNIESYQDKMQTQAITDALTGLPNRFACTEFVKSLMREDVSFALVSVDLNNFKSINDTMGQNAGNKVLLEVATRWKTAAETGLSGTNDFLSRLSGDGFAVVIQDYRTADDLEKAVRYYQTVLENRITVDDCDLYITGSFGYAEYPADAKDADALFSYADAAMYEVKRTNNSNRILRFTPDILKIERTIELERIIRTALEHDTVFFNLQPQYDISHKLRGFEALARMKDEEGKIVSPGEFIPVAEKVGLIDKLDGVVIRKAALFFGELVRKSGADITLSVNASVRHLMKNDFLDELRATLAESGLPARQLEVEITESIMIDSAEKALQCISEIKKMGVKIAIDDFGTGYSSLSYLNKFPANLLKVDKSFIDKMNSSDSSKQYVAAIISIGHIMGFDVIAEGIEEQAQLDTLREIGCDFIQGFFWGRPLPQEAAEKLVMDSVSQ